MRFRGRAVVGLVVVGLTATFAATEASAGSPTPVLISATSPCTDVVFLGLRGSGENAATPQNRGGLGPEVGYAMDAYVDNLDARRSVGYYPVPYIAADYKVLATPKAKDFYKSIDDGVKEALAFLSAREPRCRAAGEHYVLTGFSQGAMALHRTLWQLVYPSSKTMSALADAVLPRIDGILAISDGDRFAGQGGMGYGVSSGEGIWWWANGLTSSVKYPARHDYIPELTTWPANRFHSVCGVGDLVCDASESGTDGGNIHGSSYKPIGSNAWMSQRAAADMAADTIALKPLTPSTTASIPVRVGQIGSAMLAPDGMYVSSVAWLSDPIPGATLDPGVPTIPATIEFTPTTPGIYSYGVRVAFTNGSTTDVTGFFDAVATPASSLVLSNVTTTYESGTYPQSVITFDLTKQTASPSTPVGVTDQEDPATDFYEYVGGDVNGNQVLDVGERWSYRGVVPWADWEPDPSRVRTLTVYANDTSGAGAYEELRTPMTLTR